MSVENCDEAVLHDARRLIGRAREVVEFYAGDFAPIRTDQVSVLLSHNSCFLKVFAFKSTDLAAFVLPAARGVYPIGVNQLATRTDRQFAIRHELAHVIAGEVDEPTFLSDDSYMGHSERVADLFALADMVPGWVIRHMRRDRVSWRDILVEVRGAIQTECAGDWPADRLDDRARLRLRLFREWSV